jgi:arginyl-tRNA synthetase
VNDTRPEPALRRSLLRAASEALGIEPESIPLTYPPNAELGDLASPVCFELARVARRAPRQLADAIVAAFVPEGCIARVEVAGGGYINAFVDRSAFVRTRLAEGAPAPVPGGPKFIVEHTNINPNKAAHIGHLRNAVLGDTLVRFLRRLGHAVEVQNYIDDTGVQVADLVVGFRVLRREELEDVLRNYSPEALAARGERFDYVAWDLYAEVTRHYEEDESRLSHRRETLEAMERGANPVAELAAHLSQRMVQHHLHTMERLDVRYDVLPRESDILGMRFWQKAFGLLRDAGAIHEVNDGKHAGCWVGTFTTGPSTGLPCRRPIRCGPPPAPSRIPALRASARADTCTTSSTHGSRTYNGSWCRGCGSWATRTRRTAPCTTPTKWSR